uniref:Echinoderm microtubule-associated protein-like 2 n=1 Tax=Eptatretus burgeri TaxID=7764 RepID=A0A8C4QU63_EPTBU
MASSTKSRNASKGLSSSGTKVNVSYNKEEGNIRFLLRGRSVAMAVPTEQMESYSPDEKPNSPLYHLALEWVYGYRGKDCRSNVQLLPSGELVYFVAAVVVLRNLESSIQRHYLGHNDDIKCLAVHPDKTTIATGQVVGATKDKKALPAHVRVWDSASLETLHVIGEEVLERGVLCLGFSKANGGTHLCVVDDGKEKKLSVWEWNKGVKISDSKCSTEVVFAAEFNPHDDALLVTCGKNNINFWKLEGKDLVRKQGIFESHEKPKYILCVEFTKSGDVISGDSNGNLYIWGKGTNRITRAVPAVHKGGVIAMSVLPSGTLVTGGKDSCLTFFDADLQKQAATELEEHCGAVRALTSGGDEDVFVGTYNNFIVKGGPGGAFHTIARGHTDEVWGLAAHLSRDLVLTCGADKQVFLWDTVKHQLIWSVILEEPARSADFHPTEARVAIGTYSGRWFVLDAETGEVVTQHTDGDEKLSVVRYSPDGKYLAIGSHDNYLYLYNVCENGCTYKEAGKCSGHSSFVTHLDWASDSQHFMSNSGDYEILYWDVEDCKRVTSADDVRDLEWATSSCILRFDSIGIWSQGMDGTDINAACRAHGLPILATADDFGKVHVFAWPAHIPQAPSHAYGGHSSHVTNVTCSHDDSNLFTTGGMDGSLLQWRVLG